MSEMEKSRGAEGDTTDVSGGTTGSSAGGIPSSIKSARSFTTDTTVTTNVTIADSNRCYVIVQRDTISKAEKRATDLFVSSDDPMWRLPPRLSDWTRNDVREWMQNVCPAIREHQADVFTEHVTDGNSLRTYNEENLQRDFGLTETEVESFVDSRTAWLTKENENRDYVFSRVSEVGGTSNVGLHLKVHVSYNIELNNANDCIVLINEGNRLGRDNLPHVDIPVNMEITNPAEAARQRLTYDAIYLFMKKAAQQIGIKGIQEIIDKIENEGECSLEKIERGSIRFIVRFYSQEDLEKFRERCLKGELAEKLTHILTADDEIRKVAGKDLKFHMTIKDTDYTEALRILHPSESETHQTEVPVSQAGIQSTEDLSSGASSEKQDSSRTPLREEETKWAFGLRNLKKLQRIKLQNFSLKGDGLNKIAKSLMQLGNFVELDVSDNLLGGSSRDWTSYLQNMKNLDKIDFSACDLTGRDAKTICLLVRNKYKIQLNLSGNRELGGSTDKWVKPFHRIKNLNEIDLSDSNVKSSNVEEIISNLHNVEDLNLSSNELGGSLELWTPALKKLNKLNKLVLRSCALTAEDLKYIDANLEQNKNFHELDISGNHGIGSPVGSVSLPKTLKKLNMSDCCLNGQALDQYITDDASLVDINLSKNKNIVTSALAIIIRKLKKIEKLSLSGCSLTGEFMEDILGACPQLIDLDISDNESLRGTLSLWSGKVEEMENLQRLNLGRCKLASEDVGQVVTTLKDADKFKELILSGNTDIGGSHLTIVAGMDYLNTLDLSDCKLKQEYIVDLLQRKCRLTELIISKNDDLGGTLALWAQHLPHLDELHKLDLGCTSLTGNDVGPLCEALTAIPSFNELCIAGNEKLGESSQCWGIIGQMKLKKLDISGCSLTEMGLRNVLDFQANLGEQGKLEELDMSLNPDLGEALISQ